MTIIRIHRAEKLRRLRAKLSAAKRAARRTHKALGVAERARIRAADENVKAKLRVHDFTRALEMAR